MVPHPRRSHPTRSSRLHRQLLDIEHLEDRSLLSASAVDWRFDEGGLNVGGHDVDCACPGCCGGAQHQLGDGHYIGDGHDHTHQLVTDPLGNDFFVEPLSDRHYLWEDSGPAPTGGFATYFPGSDSDYDLSATFHLESFPGADRTILLDFDGHLTRDTYWNDMVDGADIDTPAWSRDGDRNSFTNSELVMIQRIWARVAEDFAPFEVNVTTADPGAEALKRTNSSDSQYGIRVVIGENTFYSSAGGVAYVGSFSWSSDTPAFVFNSSERGVAEAASHEAGHALRLRHDGDSSTSYYRGHGSGKTSWGPIMGASYNPNVTQWSKGEYADANNLEDDLSIISSYIPYRKDDYGNTVSSATELVPQGTTEVLPTYGIIERNTDADVFSFYAGVGTLDLDIDPVAVGPNLDIKVEFLDSSGKVIETANPADRLDVDFTYTTSESGEYFLRVSGTGSGDVGDTGYSDYGSLGNYRIQGTIPAYTQGNRAPVANDDEATISEDSQGVLQVLKNDFDPDQDALTLASFTKPSHGSVVQDGTSLVYTPDNDFNGTDTFTYVVSDGRGETATAKVTVFVASVNDPPVAQDDDFTTELNTSLIGNVLTGAGADSDIDGDTLTAALVSDVSNGTLALNSDGRFEYTPNAGFVGSDSFTYAAEDGQGGSATAKVTITVENTVGVIDFTGKLISFGGSQDRTGTVEVGNGGTSLEMVGNRWVAIPFDYQVTSGTVLEFDFSSTKEGEIHGIGFDTNLSLSNSYAFKVFGTQGWGRRNFDDYSVSDGTKPYVINVGAFYTGKMKYLFFANDHDVGTPTAHSKFSNVRVYEKGQTNIAPTANKDSATTVEGAPTVIDVLVNDSDPNGDKLTVSSVTQGANGSVVINSDNTVTYTPKSGFVGSDAFTYTADDGRGGSAIATVNVTVKEAGGVIDFTDQLISFGGSQDRTGTVEVGNGGTSVEMVGNRWVAIPFDYQVTSNTVLEFDFSSTSEGEIHGIGFDTNLSLSNSYAFKVFGTQGWGRRNFDDYSVSDGTKPYVINVGAFYTGKMNYLFFANDHDVGTPTAHSKFSNVRVYEEGPVNGFRTAVPHHSVSLNGGVAVKPRSHFASVSSVVQGSDLFGQRPFHSLIVPSLPGYAANYATGTSSVDSFVRPKAPFLSVIDSPFGGTNESSGFLEAWGVEIGAEVLSSFARRFEF
ncbi:MAG: Ig-like domain-containing protein [Gemmataceae bacterium]